MNKCSHDPKISPIRSKRVIDDMLSMYALYVIICSQMTETVLHKTPNTWCCGNIMHHQMKSNVDYWKMSNIGFQYAMDVWWINSLMLTYSCMRQQPRPLLIHKKAYRHLGVKLISKPMLTYCQLHWKLNRKYHDFHSRKSISKFCL